MLAAMTGQAGLTMAEENKLIGIILDLGLPDINGAEVLYHLKSNAQTRSIPEPCEHHGWNDQSRESRKPGKLLHFRNPL